MIETHPFGNFIPQNIKYFLLGSFPSNLLKTDPNYDWFYSSKRSQFWNILSQVYNLELSNKIQKQNLFNNLELGVGDIIYKCERRDRNSLDNNLINIVYNPDLEEILIDNAIKKVYFSSKYVETLFKRKFKDILRELINIEFITLPSPSPRYAAMSKLQKIEKYKDLLPNLI